MMRWMTGFLILAGGLAFAQQGHIAGPVSGYVFDRAGRTLRPVVGVPGASVIGGPIDLGFPASNVWVAPRLDSAVAVAADGSLHFLRIDSGAAAELSFNGATIAPQSVVFSPSGSAAALFARNRATIITGLPGAPVTAGTIDLAAELARPSRLPSLHTVSSAVSDDGAYLLRASGGKVILYGTGGEHRTLADGVEAAFAPGAHKAAIADPSGAGVVVFDDVAAGSGGKSVAAADSSMASPAGIAFSADGGKLFLASAGARNVTSFDLAGGGRSALPCNCTPGALVRMGSVFRLTELGTDPLWLLDAAPAEPRVVFVPALSAN